MKIRDSAVVAGVATAGAVATFYGGTHAAWTAGVLLPVALLYPLMLDGLGFVAWRSIHRRHRRVFAWFVLIAACGTSGLAQAYVLAHTMAERDDASTGLVRLAAGIGAAPAVIVLFAAILGTGTGHSTDRPAETSQHHPDTPHGMDTPPPVGHPDQVEQDAPPAILRAVPDAIPSRMPPPSRRPRPAPARAPRPAGISRRATPGDDELVERYRKLSGSPGINATAKALGIGNERARRIKQLAEEG